MLIGYRRYGVYCIIFINDLAEIRYHVEMAPFFTCFWRVYPALVLLTYVVYVQNPVTRVNFKCNLGNWDQLSVGDDVINR